MVELTEQATLADIQQYIKEWEIKNGFDHCTVTDGCLFLGEEVGELFKAIRKQYLPVDPNSDVYMIEDEIADCLMQLAAIANRCGVNMATAIINKEKKNNERKWKAVE